MPIVMTFLKSWKLWVALGVTGALSGAALIVYDHIYDSGYNAARVKYQTEQLRAVEDAVQEARAKWAQSQEAAEVQIQIEEKIVERVRVVERRVPKIVERVVPGECRDLGVDIQRLFNDAIRAGDSGKGSTPAPPTVSYN